jgi:hypothetical protein
LKVIKKEKSDRKAAIDNESQAAGLLNAAAMASLQLAERAYGKILAELEQEETELNARKAELDHTKSISSSMKANCRQTREEDNGKACGFYCL